MKYPKQIGFIKIISLFSAVRGYNILILAIAQYLASIFILSPENSLKLIFLDKQLFFIVLASVCVVAAGYLVNNFYDAQIDKINRPVKTSLDQIVGQQTQLTLYFLLNFLGFFFGWLVSWRAALFFSSYIFGIWLYSHRLKKRPFSGFLSASILTIFPFFALFVYFKNFSAVIFVHALFLFFIIIIRQLIKDMENIKGAIANNYDTLAVKYGEEKTKKWIVSIMLLAVIPCLILANNNEIYYMKYYFHFSAILLPLMAIYLWKSQRKSQYMLLHNLLKMILLIGIFSLLLINPSLWVKKLL